MTPPEDKVTNAPLRLPSRQGKFAQFLRASLAFVAGQSARQGYLAAIDQAVISLSNFLATILVARNASPTELGVYSVGFVAVNLLRNTTEGIVIQPLNVIGATLHEDEIKIYASSTAAIQVTVAALAALLAASAGFILTQLGNDVAGPVLFSLWFVFITWPVQEYVRRLLYTRGAIFLAVSNTILANGIRLGLMVWLAGRGRLTGISGLATIAWGACGALIFGLWATRSYWTLRNLHPIETWKRNWDFGKWMVGGTITNWVSVEFYPVLTAGLISFAAAGAYRALQNLVAPIHMLLRATDTYLTPRAARDYHHSGRKSLTRTLRFIYIIDGIPVVAMLICALTFPTQILHLFYGETYVAYSPGIIWMALFYLLWFGYWPLQTALKAARLTRPIFIANLAAIVVMFSLGIDAIRLWGVYGTIIGQAMNALVVNLVLWAAWIASMQQPPRQSSIPPAFPPETKRDQHG